MPHPGAFGLLLTLHVVLAVFVLGPLSLVCVTAPVLLRATPGPPPVLLLATQLVRVLAAASALIVITGVGLVHQGSFGSVRSLDDGWLLGSLALWFVGCASCLGIVAPGMSRAIADVEAGRQARRRISAVAFGAAVSTACWLVVAALMVIKPGA
ncbi:putative integral membrane protein [Frankia sp. AiPs1]|uniref:hypothetical protein n=1 Tax=Frankia sp. AiPa1 TaxID=573492 RepID=UPI00202AE85D|nr:hypothetical protein [Frankia sp. AiPa1]MCL9758271.1 hypothetical protein [Frankia sp. AiPa1]